MRKASLLKINEIGYENEKVIFIGSDLGAGILDEMKENLPNQFLMEGVSEQNIIGIAAGLAFEGFIPFVNTIATFLTRRCFEQIAIDLCLHNLPVKLIANGGGAVYAPLGPTHLATDDIGILRTLPNMTIIAPCDAVEMKKLIEETIDWPSPVYIRLGKGGDKIITEEKEKFIIGKAIIKKEPQKGLFVTTGIMSQMALEACKILEKENIICGVMHMHTIKPLDGKTIKEYFPDVESIVTVEEHSIIGGLGSSILEFCNINLPKEIHKISRIGIPDKFSDQYGNQNSLLSHWGINPVLISIEMKKNLLRLNN